MEHEMYPPPQNIHNICIPKESCVHRTTVVRRESTYTLAPTWKPHHELQNGSIRGLVAWGLVILRHRLRLVHTLHNSMFELPGIIEGPAQAKRESGGGQKAVPIVRRTTK